jgi:putative nucleotidyltransferase with HDIG domain
MQLNEEIKRIKEVMVYRINEDKLPVNTKSLVKMMPEELKDLFFKQWNAKQSKKWHPEGNTLKHILVVLKRAYHHFQNDPNMIMAALFHDLGKMDTYAINPKTGEPTAYGHEDESVKYVEQFADWISSFEDTDVDEIKYLVKNHMKVKPRTWDEMRDSKKEVIMSHPAFEKLMHFTQKLDGGGTNIA